VTSNMVDSKVFYNVDYTGLPKKVSHYQESSLNRIKNRQCKYSAHKF